ncbi:MAG: hypothetical protein RJA83_661 [Pseudomonadota bacterium]|jgi:hypothetical protein
MNQNEIVQEEPKLYAGKYKSVEELEKGYCHSLQALNEIKSELKSFTAPEEYIIPDVKTHHEIISRAKELAKSTGLSQSQFDAVVRKMDEKNRDSIEKFEESKKRAGEKLDILEDYVSRHYPKKLKSTIINSLVMDPEAMDEALKHRESMLNTQVPGIHSARGSSFSTNDNKEKEKMIEAMRNYNSNPTKENLDYYMKRIESVAKNKKV